MKKIISSLSIIVCLFLSVMLPLQATAAGEGGPIGLLQSISDQMIAQLKSNQATLKSNPGLVYRLANRIVVPHADLDEMSKRVLPAKTWAAATPQQRAQFKKEFTTTLIRTYASALAEYKDQAIKFFPIRGGVSGSTVKVDSQIIRSDGPSISVQYSLINRGAGWKLYDMTVEGVSMLESFRSQFSDKLANEDMGALVRDLSSHNSDNDGSH